MNEAVATSIPAGTLRAWCLRRIARPQPAQEFLPQIDGLRFVAILAVILYHLQGFAAVRFPLGDAPAGWVRSIMAEGHFGVPLFFALSGYILGRPFLGERKPALKDYFLRRLTRLEPPYVICLLLIFALKLAGTDATFGSLFPHLLASLAYLHGWIFGTHSEVNGVAWSLEVEWQFYVLAPLLFALVARSGSRLRHAALWLAMALGGIAHTVDYHEASRIGLSLLHYFGFFAAGAWVAVLDTETPSRRRGGAYDLLGLAAWIGVIACLLKGGAWLGSLPALTALVLLSGLRGSLSSRFLGWWPIYCVGAMCYSVYLYHFFVISFLGKALAAALGTTLAPWQQLLLLPIAVAAVLFVCAIPYLLVERPFMVWRPGKNRLVDAFRSIA